MITFQNFYSKYKYQAITLLAHIIFIVYAIIFPYYMLIGILLGWVISNLFHYLYMHRIFTHHHFIISDRQHTLGLAMFTLMNLGSPPVYAAVHMKHHANSGKENDPHDPYRLGFLRSILSLWDSNFSPDRRVLSHYLRDPKVRWFHTHHLAFAIISAIIAPFIIVTSFWLSKIVVVLVHIKSIGYKLDKSSDSSRNVWWLKPLTWGEELHNNHHHYSGHANHNIQKNWKEFDILYYIGKMIERKP